MTFDLSSLQGKITTVYIALVFGTLVLALIAFLDLLFLQRQIREGEVVSDLRNAVSEMRREEKNLFLYADRQARLRADEYAKSSLQIVRTYEVSLAALMQQSAPSDMIATLQAYRGKLGDWEQTSRVDQQQIEDDIRTLGHQIYITVEFLSKQERSMLEAAVKESRWFLLIFLPIIGLAIYIVGHRAKRVVLLPLKRLESYLKPIADGRFNHLQPPSDDREFITFTDAFNGMLKELEIRQRRMLQSEKLASLGILASGVAHELNNPLSNISSSTQLLMEEFDEADADPEQLRTWLKQIDSETERGKNIVRTMLDFGSQKVFQKNRIKLLDLVNETQSLIGKALLQHSAKLTVNIPDELVLVVDKQRIQQMFINLIQNALHAAGKGVHVKISAIQRDNGGSMIPEGAEVAGSLTCVSDHAGPFVEILVVDDGPGIPQETLPKVFDPFFTTSEPGKGVGLGMFIIQEIVREHDGCLAIASRAGEGTKVIVLFPGEEQANG
ncbi:MAG: HAMP domain-containing sensor histidine kinase [Candidatus Thiodiazotropha sp.]